MKKIFSILMVLLSVTAAAQELKKQILREGAGPEARPTDEVVINYSLWQINRDQKESLIENQKLGTKFILDEKKLLPGIFQGLIGSKKGQRFVLTIPPNLAYGGKNEGEINPDATLKVEIEVIDLKPQP